MGHGSPKENFPAPPEAWGPMRRMAGLVRAPVDSFLANQAAGGLVLLAAAAIALVWANLGHHSYHDFWSTPITLSFGEFSFGPTLDHPHQGTLHFWINDGLMTIFFMVAGFEIKREMHHGELSDMARASLPIATAIGGMVIPALIYFSLNTSGPQAAGWGVPMATDIAFALGILSLLGNRVPSAMRILLLALAIIDDLGAILVIAIFYSGSINPTGLTVAGLGLVILFLIRRTGLRPGVLDLLALIPLWVGLHMAGIHATLAGVILGLSAPARAWLPPRTFAEIAKESLDEYNRKNEDGADEHELVAPLRRLTVAGREAISPVVRGETEFHGWVAYFIMPLFALANAGVYLGGIDFSDAASTMIVLGVALGLGIGKPLGIMAIAWLAVRAGLAKLPRGVGWSHMLVVGLVAGIGFTMSIFIAELAFAESPGMLGVAKLAILIATAAAGILAMAIGRFALPEQSADMKRITASDAESSAEY